MARGQYEYTVFNTFPFIIFQVFIMIFSYIWVNIFQVRVVESKNVKKHFVAIVIVLEFCSILKKSIQRTLLSLRHIFRSLKLYKLEI